MMEFLEGEDVEERLAYMEACGAILEDKKYWRSGVRSEEYKYVWAPYNEDIEEELYDLRKDPRENDNLIDEKPDVARSLREYGEGIRSQRKI